MARILKNELTLPKSPALTTKLRAEHSNLTIKSQARIEEEQMEQIKPFKANPVNRKVNISNSRY